MRTYLILREKVRRFREDTEIQSLLATIRETHGESVPASYSRSVADKLKAATFDRPALAARGLAYERLDQLLIDLLLGVR
jgi:xylose isomerase